MAAASNLALKISDLDTDVALKDAGPALREAYLEARETNVHIIGQANPLEEAQVSPAIINQINQLESELEASTDPGVLLKAKEGRAVAWRYASSPQLLKETDHIIDVLGERELEIKIELENEPDAMMRDIRTQLEAQLPGVSIEAFIHDIRQRAWLMFGQSGSPVLYLRLSSHGTPLDDFKKSAVTMATVYRKGAVDSSGIHKQHALNFAVATPGAGAGVDTKGLVEKLQPKDGSRYLVLELSADKTSSMDIPRQIKNNRDFVLEGEAGSVFATPVADKSSIEGMKEDQVIGRIAKLSMDAASTWHPDTDPKKKQQFARQLGQAVEEIMKLEALDKLSVLAALKAAKTLRDLTENHDVIGAHPEGEKMRLDAQEIARDIERPAPKAAFDKLYYKAPANDKGPMNKQRLSAMTTARLAQIENAGDDAAELIDENLIEATAATPGFEQLSKTFANLHKTLSDPVRRRTELKSEAPQMEELKAIDPKGTLKFDAKGQKALRALQEQLKSDPKLRAELAKNKELAPVLETLEKIDFEKPQDVAKLAAQIAKLPKEAKAEIAARAPEFAEVAQQITLAVTLEALAPKLQEPLDALKEMLAEKGIQLNEAQQAKIEEITQLLAEAKDPEAFKEIARQLKEVIAELPPEATAELPQLKEFSETVTKWEYDPAAFDEFVAQHVELHADTQIYQIEQVEAAHLGAEVSAKLEMTLNALQDLPLDEAQQAQLDAIIQQAENIDPADLKEMIAQLGDLMKSPEISAALPAGIREIADGLKEKDLSLLTRTEMPPKVKADLSAKLNLTMEALEDTPLRPADRKQLQEITKQLASSDPVQVRQAIKQLDKLVAALPPESKLPPAFTEMRESLKAIEQPAARSRFETSPKAEFRPSAKPVEFSPATVSAIRQLQQTVRSAPAASGLSLPPRQIEMLVKADVSQPAVQQQVMQILRAAQTAPVSNDNQTANPPAPAVQQLQKIMQQPEIKSAAIIQQIQRMDGAPRVQITSTAVLPVLDAPKQKAANLNIAITPTTGSSKLWEIVNDPNAPPEVRAQALARYHEQKKREKEQELLQQLEQAQSQKPTPAAIQAHQQAVQQDLKAAKDENQNIQRQLQQQAAVQTTVVHEQVAGVAVAAQQETTIITNTSNQDYQSAITPTQDQIMAAGAAAVIAAAHEALVVPVPANTNQAPAQNNDVYINPLSPNSAAPETHPCKSCPLFGTVCGGGGCGNSGYTQAAIDKMAAEAATGGMQEIQVAQLPAHNDLSGMDLKNPVAHVPPNTPNIMPDHQSAQGRRYHEHGYSGDPKDCPYMSKIMAAQEKGAADTLILDNPSGDGAEQATKAPPKKIEVRTRSKAPPQPPM